MKQAFEAGNENIQAIADRFEISHVLLDLAAAIGTNDIAALDEIFTSDAVIEQSPALTSTSQHQISSANIVINGDTARSRTLCHGPQELPGHGLCYVDKFRRTAKGWRIIERSTLAQIPD